MNKQPVMIRPEFVSAETDGGTANASLAEFLSVVRRQKWKIISFMLLAAVTVGIFASRMRPLYESTAELSIEHPGGTAVIGQDGSGNSGPVNDMDQLLTTHIEALQSDPVLRPVEQRFHLLEQEGQLSGKSSTERNKIENGPIVLNRLKVTRPPNTYILRIDYRAHDSQLAADVANAIAEAYVDHSAEAQVQASVDRASVMQRQLVELKSKMTKSEAALTALENQLSFDNSEAHTTMLEARYGQLSTEYGAAQEERLRKEAALHAVLSGGVVAAQSSPQGDTLAHAIERLAEARQKFAQVKAIYGSNHAEYRKAANEVQELGSQVEEVRGSTAKRVESEYNQSLAHEQMLSRLLQTTKAELDQSSPVRHKYNQLKRESESDKQLYDEMSRRIKEHEINGSFRHGLARVMNIARASAKPVFPNVPLLVIIASMAAFLLAIGGALVMDAFDQTLLDPEQAARSLKVNFLGALPELTKGAASLRTNQIPSKPSTSQSLANYEEAVRTVRNTLNLVDYNSENRTMMFTSALPSEGKSTTVTHLAQAFASHGKRTLMIDADLRRPSLHKRLGVQPEFGLSGALEGFHAWRDAVISVPTIKNLYFLSAGSTTLRASDLVTDRIAKIIEEAAREYDLVIVDAPPLLGFAETLQIGTAVDAVVLVTQAGRTPGKLVASAITTLQRVRINVVGLLLNRANENAQGYGYSYKGYGHPQRRVDSVTRRLDKTA